MSSPNRAFRRLLFMEDAADLSGSPRTNNEKNGPTPPSRMKLQSLPFFKDLRPSTLLGYLSSCGPSQLPSPYLSLSVTGSVLGSGTRSNDSSESALQIYIDFLTSIQSHSSDSSNSHNQRQSQNQNESAIVLSVSSLFLTKTTLGMRII